MIIVKLSPLDQKDLLELLEYALEKKMKEPPEKHGRYTWDNSGWYRLRIDQLIQLIKGNNVYDTIYQSSLSGIVDDIVKGMDNDYFNN